MRKKQPKLVPFKFVARIKRIGFNKICKCYYGYNHHSKEDPNPYDFFYTEIDTGYSDNSNKFRTSAPSRKKFIKWVVKNYPDISVDPNDKNDLEDHVLDWVIGTIESNLNIK